MKAMKKINHEWVLCMLAHCQTHGLLGQLNIKGTSCNNEVIITLFVLSYLYLNRSIKSHLGVNAHKIYKHIL